MKALSYGDITALLLDAPLPRKSVPSFGRALIGHEAQTSAATDPPPFDGKTPTPE